MRSHRSNMGGRGDASQGRTSRQRSLPAVNRASAQVAWVWIPLTLWLTLTLPRGAAGVRPGRFPAGTYPDPRDRPETRCPVGGVPGCRGAFRALPGCRRGHARRLNMMVAGCEQLAGLPSHYPRREIERLVAGVLHGCQGIVPMAWAHLSGGQAGASRPDNVCCLSSIDGGVASGCLVRSTPVAAW